jgi:chromosome partitioning protein
MSKSRKPPSCAVSFANGKGGVGKTSLIANLAVRAARDAHVALLDYDPQQSLARWCELRANAYGNQLNPRLWKNGEGAPVDVAALKQLGTDWILQDVPPATWHLIEDSVRASDLVVIPVKASPIDLEAVDPIIEVCTDLQKPFLFVLTQYDPRWSLSESAFPYLEAKAPGHTIQEVFSYRQAYVGSMIGGATGPEYTKDRRQAADAEAEIDALWLRIRKLAMAELAKKGVEHHGRARADG